MDDNKITDFYWGFCAEHIIESISWAVKDFAKKFKTIPLNKERMINKIYLL